MPTQKNNVTTVLSDEEKKIVEMAAIKEKLSLSAWIKKTILEAASKK